MKRCKYHGNAKEKKRKKRSRRAMVEFVFLPLKPVLTRSYRACSSRGLEKCILVYTSFVVRDSAPRRVGSTPHTNDRQSLSQTKEKISIPFLWSTLPLPTHTQTYTHKHTFQPFITEPRPPEPENKNLI